MRSGPDTVEIDIAPVVVVVALLAPLSAGALLKLKCISSANVPDPGYLVRVFESVQRMEPMHFFLKKFIVYSSHDTKHQRNQDTELGRLTESSGHWR